MKSKIQIAAEAHTNLNIFGAIVAILEGGTIYGGDNAAVNKILNICAKEKQRQLEKYDAARMNDTKDIHTLALEVSREVMKIINGPKLLGGDVQMQAKVQCAIIGALSSIKDQQAQGAMQKPVQAVPEYRGYAHLGTGQYVINNSASNQPAELIISIATDEEKEGRSIGEERENSDDAFLMPDAMCVRIRFENVAGLNALEQQLGHLRNAHFQSDEIPEIKPSNLQEPYGYVDKFDQFFREKVEGIHMIPVYLMVMPQEYYDLSQEIGASDYVKQPPTAEQDQGRDDVIERLECKHCGSDLHIGHKFDCKLKEPSNGN